MTPPLIVDGTLQLTHTQVVANNTVEYTFAVQQCTGLLPPQQPTPFSFIPGQFINIAFTPTQSRAYSIASAPDPDILTLLIRLLPDGLGSQALANANIGDTFPFRGPFGHFVLQDINAPLVFLATGTGIAPFVSMLRSQIISADQTITIFYGGRDSSDIAHIQYLHDHPQVQLSLGLTQTTDFGVFDHCATQCRITALIQDQTFIPETHFYLCGNGNMIEQATLILKAKGIPKQHIFAERFY